MLREPGAHNLDASPRSRYLSPDESEVSQTGERPIESRALRPPRTAPWAHFQLLVENLADGVTVQDETGRLVYANERGARMSGYESAAALLTAPPGDYQRRFELLDAMGLPVPLEALPGRIAMKLGKASTTLRVRDRITRADRWTEVRAYRVRAEGGDSFIVNIFRDVTDVVEQQRLLEEQAEELEQQSTESQALADELEQANEELLRSLQDAEAARALAEERQQWLTRLHSVTVSLSRAMLPDEVVVIAMTAGTDSFHSDGAAIWLVNDDANALRLEGSLGRTGDTLARYADIPLASSAVQAEAARLGEVVAVGGEEHASLLAIPIRVGGRSIGVASFFFSEPRRLSADFTSAAKTIGKEVGLALDRTRTRAELDSARVAAEAASEAKSSFLATMSHELRTPINAILGFTDLLQLGIANGNAGLQSDYLNRIRRSTEHLLELINDVLDISKIEAGTLSVAREPAQAQDVVSEAVALMRAAAAERHLRIESSCPDGVAYLGDALRVRQILLNLLSNAVKFSHEGGMVRLICERRAAERVVAFQVIDDGIGIAEQSLESIFDPFTQAERGYTRTHGGTGLGLSISRQLARLMDGDIEVTSKLGSGSTFVLTLPTNGR